MKTITTDDLPKQTLYAAITFTSGFDVYVTKDLAQKLNLPERHLLLHIEKGKILVSATDKNDGFQVSLKSGMLRVTKGRALSHYMRQHHQVKPGTRIVFDTWAEREGYYIEVHRAPTKARGVAGKAKHSGNGAGTTKDSILNSHD